ncbi:sodium:calcium antiporter [Candidatus Woesearchaeota archaeon]|nr:sodium:calcium antiporter [Candidatus Woesearchaeota archaeon]
MLTFDILIFLLSCIVLVFSGSWLVKSLSKIAYFLNMSEFVIGFIIMAFSTSIPELFVGITSAMAKNSALALGTVIGSNIADLTIVIGIAVILAKGIKIKSKKIQKDALYMVFIVALPIGLMLIGNELSRLDGIILLVVFLIYVYHLIKERKEFKKEVEERINHWDIVLNVVIFILSLILLFFSAKFVVDYATTISLKLLLPPILVGLFIIAIGTSLPELIFNLQAVIKKHPEMALGDTIGSVVMNSTLVLGVTAVIYPITANFLLFFSSALLMLIIAFIFATFVESGKKLYVKEGIALVLLYTFFIMIEFYIKTLGG